MARFLLALVVIACIVIGVGFYLDWFRFDANREKVVDRVSVNREKVDEDVAKAKERAKDLGEKAKNVGEQAKEKVKALTGTQTAKGKVKQADPQEHRFAIETTDHKELLTLYTDADSKVERDGKDVGPDALKGGEHGSDLVPGNAEKSRIYRLAAGLDKPAMPIGGKLSSDEIESIRLWINQGAVWPETALAAKTTTKEAPPKPKAESLLPADFKPTDAEQKAIAKLAQSGMDIRPIAMNVPWHEANLRLLGSNVTAYDVTSQARLAQLRSGFIASGSDPVTATSRAYGALFGMVQRQASMVSFVTIFQLLGLLFLALIPLVLIMRRPTHQGASPAAH